MKKASPNKKSFSKNFDKFSTAVTKATGSPAAFLIAMSVIIVWGITGPIFKFSDTWQLIINTGTTIITFLMVFVIQQSQNKDTIAIQLKLNELIASSDKASNRIINAEGITEEELLVIHKYYERLAAMAKTELDIHSSHSIDEAKRRHEEKASDKKKTAK